MQREEVKPVVESAPVSAGASKKVFVIGFIKCGTTSFHRLFSGSGLRAAHWRTDEAFLACTIFANMALRRNLLTGLTRFDAFTDIIYLDEQTYLEANVLFPTLHAENPDALFILNTRDREKWLASRLSHGAGQSRSMIRRTMAALRASQEDVVAFWSRQWDDHHAAVRAFFADKDTFVEFDIDKDSPEKLVRFFEGHGMTLKAAAWGQHNVTKRAKA